MSDCGLLCDVTCREHVTPATHPERPERLSAIAEALAVEGLDQSLTRLGLESVSVADLTRVHDSAYLARLRSACAAGESVIDTPDCPLCPATEHIAGRVTGGVTAAARAIMEGELRRAFCATRPPGHHAERATAMGFCYYNHVAVAARAVQADQPELRVAIYDFDVHHGNGTQHLFEDDPTVLYVSTHEHPDYQYPGTGYAEEIGRGVGRGATCNIPLMPHTDDDGFLEVVEREVLPALREFRPDLLILSAGFDAHLDDPLGHLDLTDDGFAAMTAALLALADDLCGGRVLSVLEGGYNLDVLRRCVTAHVAALAQGDSSH